MKRTFLSFVLLIAYAASAQWTKGMDDDAGKAKATSSADLPAADFTGMRHIYPKRDRLFTTSLDGTWAFKLANGLATPDVLKGWNEPGYDTREWDDIQVPGNWGTQGLKFPQYRNQIDEMSGFYVRRFRWDYRWEGQRVILRFDGVLFGYEVWLNGKYVGRWGSAYNLAQWDVTDKLVKGRNTIAVKVITRSHGWLFDTNDCWALAGIFRNVELFTVPNDYIEDVVFRTESIVGRETSDERREDVSRVSSLASDAQVSVSVFVGAFDEKASRAKKVYVSLVDDDGVHVLDFERALDGAMGASRPTGDGVVGRVAPRPPILVSGVVHNAHLWSVDDPYLYTLVVTVVDGEGRKIERIAEPQGVRTARVDGRRILVNGEPVFFKGVAWNEIDPVLGRAITETERRRQMTLMKKAGVNCIRTAHYPFGPDFLRLADEMGFYVIDEVPFGSRGREFLQNGAYIGELLARTEATMRRDKNHASVVMWTFVQAIHAMGGKKLFLHDPYLVPPEVLSESGGETNKVYRLRWVIDNDTEKFIEGDVVVLDIRRTTSDTRSGMSAVECRVSTVSYCLTPSSKCASDARFAELGLALFAEGDRVDWLGDGPLTSVPGKSKMNVFGKWAIHKDDYRFAGNRSNVKWASVGSNGSVAQPLVVESGTGSVSFENVGGRICITENLAVAGYDGKASGPGSLKSPKDIKMKGSFTICAAELDAPPSDVVPDLIYTQHYGF